MDRPIVVAGAGIAGLSTAVALARRGLHVTIVERAAALTEVGAGLQLSPNAIHALRALGLGPVVDGAVGSSGVTMIDARSGARVATVPLGTCTARYGAPYVTIARPRLLAGLADAALHDPRIELVLDCTLLGVGEMADGVRVETSRGALVGAALIGADGVRSAVRRALPGGGEARPTGKVAYRATVDEAAAPTAARNGTFVWMGRAAHLVHYPIGGRVNLVAIVDEAVHGGAAPVADAPGTGAGPVDDAGWDAAASGAAVARHFGGFAEPAAALIAAVEGWRRWPLSAARPERWTAGRIGLVGDAAHAMLPFLAQGAVMAIEDAVVLAAHLAGATHLSDAADVGAALAAYEAERRPRVARVVAAAEQSGRIYHLDGIAATARNLAMRLGGGERLLSRLDWLYGWRPPA